MSLRSYAERQFSRPHGLPGRLVGTVLANRPSNRARNRWAVELLDVRPADRVLEIGFGPGLALAWILERAAQGRVVGIDHSALMVRQAETRNRAAVDAGRLELRLGGVELLPTLGAPFDHVLSVNVVQFLADRAAAFRAIRDVLAPGGVMATVYQPRHRGATSADAERMAQTLAGLASEVGLGSVRIERLEAKPLVVCVLARKGARA